ncbi:MAG: hypothetical protein M3458_02565 [Acidobacteriota bacterium]|nr:hypothetical protein [Acidobacteriota bacterium]
MPSCHFHATSQKREGSAPATGHGRPSEVKRAPVAPGGVREGVLQIQSPRARALGYDLLVSVMYVTNKRTQFTPQ